MDQIYSNIILSRNVIVKSRQLKKKKNIEEIILYNLKNRIEGKCVHEGYVKPGSIKIYERSVGKFINGHFDGNITYNVRFSANICNPSEGSNISCTVHSINKMGILCGIGIIESSPLLILLARQHHLENDLFNSIQVSDSLRVEIIGKKYELDDNQINVIGSLIEKEKKFIFKKKKKKIVKKGGNQESIDKQDFINSIVSKYIDKIDKKNGFQSKISEIKEKMNSLEWNDLNSLEKEEKIIKELDNLNINLIKQDYKNNEEDMLEL